MLLFSFALLAGCGDKISEEPETSSEVASRGKFMAGLDELREGSFTENGRHYMNAVRLFKESLIYDETYSRANAMMALAVSELASMRLFKGQTVMGVSIEHEIARQYADKAIKANPTLPETCAIHSIVYTRMGEYEVAEDSLKKARSNDREDVYYFIAKGDYLFTIPEEKPQDKAENVIDAIEEYTNAIATGARIGIPYTRLLDAFEYIDDPRGIQQTAKLLKDLGYGLPSARAARYRAAGIELP